MAIRAKSAAQQRETLLSVLEEAAGDPGEGSIAARALCSAHGFWTAVSNETLSDYLGAIPADRLRYAAIVYQAIGAIRVANTIYGTLGELTRTVTPVQGQQCIAVLQRRLLESTDPLHDLIARLAPRVH